MLFDLCIGKVEQKFAYHLMLHLSSSIIKQINKNLINLLNLYENITLSDIRLLSRSNKLDGYLYKLLMSLYI